MNSIAIIGTVLAVLGFIVYIVRNGKLAEIEKATSRETQKVALEKLEIVENAALQTESNQREREAQEIEDARKDETVTRSPIGFYPERMYPKDPNDLN